MRHVILFFFLLPLVGFSNDIRENNSKDLFLKNRRAKYPVGINLVGFGPSGIAGVSMDWFIKPKINIEIGAGLNDLKTYEIAYFAGVKYHLLGNTVLNMTPYIGVFDKVTLNSSTLSNQLYIPLGIQRIKKNKLTWNIEAAYIYNLDTFKSSFYGAFKLGYRFNRFDKKKK